MNNTTNDIRFFDWEGDACRVYNDEHGVETADIYRVGKGLHLIDSTDVLFGARQISEEMYKDLVCRKIALANKRHKDEA